MPSMVRKASNLLGGSGWELRVSNLDYLCGDAGLLGAHLDRATPGVFLPGRQADFRHLGPLANLAQHAVLGLLVVGLNLSLDAPHVPKGKRLPAVGHGAASP